VTLLPEKELLAVEAWFSDLKEALGVSPRTSRGQVLVSVRKLVTDAESYEQEKRVVAKAYGYTRWGDFYNSVKDTLVATPEVELPKNFYKVPDLWVLRDGGLTYPAAKNRLTKTVLVVKEVWEHLNAVLAADPTAAEFVEEQKAWFVSEFENSTDPHEFEQTCLAYVRNYQEEDPKTTWVEVTDEAAAVLERNYDLPTTAVQELLAYAAEKPVEATKSWVEGVKSRYYQAGAWFDYLLTAYLHNERRVTEEQTGLVRTLFDRAVVLWGCYEEVSANDPDKPNLKKRSYDPSVTVAQLRAALTKTHELEEVGEGSREEWEDAVKEAVRAAEEQPSLTTDG
jgi:hypothetical protein